MKKILSIALSVLLLASAFTVLTVLPASAATVTAAAGGTASVEGTTFKATPYYGNTFKGWYEAGNETAVSTNPTFTTDEYTALEARFNVYNQIVDGSFENGTVGQDYFNQYSGSAAGKKNVIANAPTGSGDIHGNKVLECVPTAGNTTNEYLLHIPVTVEKNKDYTFHLSYYMPGYKAFSFIGVLGANYTLAYNAYGILDKWSLHWQKEGTTSTGAWSFMGSQTPSTFFHKTVNSNIGVTASTWTDVLVMFNSGDDATIFADGQDTATVYIQFGAANSNANTYYIDNVCFSEATEALTDVEVLADNGGLVASTSAPQKTLSPVVYYDTNGTAVGTTAPGSTVANSTRYSAAKTSAQEYTATPYNDNLFDGWYDENGVKVSSDTTISVDGYSKLTAKFVNNNQIPDGDFYYGKGVAEMEAINGSRVVTITELASAYEGKGMNVAISGNSLMAIKMPVTVKKATDYVLSYNMKINSFAPTGETATPVYAHMVAAIDGAWNHWPALNGWKITIRNAEDYTKSMTVTSTDAREMAQIKFADIQANCGSGWLEFILEFNTGTDTTAANVENLFANSDTAQMFMSLGYNFAVANIDYDNFAFYEANYSPIFHSKENVKTVRVGIGTVAAGADYSFKLSKDDATSVVVNYNNRTIQPVDGVYTLNLVDDKNVYITASTDSSFPLAGKDWTGNDLTEYDHEIYNKPVWEGDTVYHETVVFYKGRTEATLMYPISEIVSVRSFDLQDYYVLGSDFDVVDGKLVLLDGSSIPVYPYTPFSADGTWASDTDGLNITQYSGGSVYPKTIVVTYKHTGTWADNNATGYTGTKQESVEDELDVFTKLRNGEDVHIVFYGDSMTSGWSISGGLSYVYTAANDGTLTDSGLYTAPYAPSWMEMFIEGLKKEYPTANITYENLSLGGKASTWGLQNFEARYALLNNKDIDLFLLGWGINDAGGSVAKDTFKSNSKAIIDLLRTKCSDASVLMYSGHCTNTDAAMYDETLIASYEAALYEIQGEVDNTAATALTSIFFDIMKSKESSDIFENNLNHTNDFGCRVYSQVMINAMSKKYADNDTVPAAPTIASKTDTTVTLNEVAGYEYSMDGRTWQTSATFTGLSAATEYSFYQREAATATSFASVASAATKTTTDKATVAAPAAPATSTVTSTTVTLVATNGYEYSKDGGTTWQASPEFTGLTPNTQYEFVQRVAETATAYASPVSAAKAVTTPKHNTQAPAAPTVASKTDTSVTLNAVAGYEYSKDGTTWQASAEFTGLSAATEYSFYQRVAETSDSAASPASAATKATTDKSAQAAPAAPTVELMMPDLVKLNAVAGCEYSMDGTNWQASPEFRDLTPDTAYTFYQRKAETATAYASAASAATAVTTDKWVEFAPNAPVADEVTQTSVKLVATAGFEYSMDGTTWQTSAEFTGLTANTAYTFYQRVAETATSYASAASDAATIKTLKAANTETAVAVEILEVTYNSVTLKEVDGYEYSKDGVNWQASPVFTGLTAETAYTFYQRIAETDDFAASAAVSTAATTEAAPVVSEPDDDTSSDDTSSDNTSSDDTTSEDTSSKVESDKPAEEDKTPATGDSTNIWMWAVLLVLSAAAAAFTFAKKRSSSK